MMADWISFNHKILIMAKKKNEEEMIDEVSEAGAVLPVSDGADDATDPVSDEAPPEEDIFSKSPTEEDIMKTIEVDGLQAVHRIDHTDDESGALIAIEASYSDGSVRWFGDPAVEERVKSERLALLQKAGLGEDEQPDEQPDETPVELGATKLPTRGPLAKKVRCFNEGCGWSGVLAEMKVDERLKRPHYCPNCGYSSKIEDVEG